MHAVQTVTGTAAVPGWRHCDQMVCDAHLQAGGSDQKSGYVQVCCWVTDWTMTGHAATAGAQQTSIHDTAMPVHICQVWDC
jgi:hypothetical protein